MRTMLILFCSLTLIWASCKTQQKVSYDFPSTMAPAVRKQYTDMCDKGKILYDINCAGCHNTVVKGKQVIPDFAPDKLTGYGLRISNSQHSGSMPDAKVSPEELGLITFFLGYKKKNTR